MTTDHKPGDEAPKEKPKKKISAKRVLIALGWEKRPDNSETPQGRGEDLLARLGVRGGALGGVVIVLMKVVAAIDRQSVALEDLGKGVAAQVKQATEGTETLKGLVQSSDLNRREQELTTRETKAVGEKVDKLADAIGVRKGETTPVAPANVRATPVGRGKP